MAQPVLDSMMKKGEEIFQNVSGKLLEKPAVMKALEAAMAGKSKVDQGVAVALKKMNVQTRSEFRGLKVRVDALELQVAELRETIAALESPAAKSKRPARPRRAAKKA
jgi:polyhydroxyalkanoate synthesis regulator phasin